MMASARKVAIILPEDLHSFFPQTVDRVGRAGTDGLNTNGGQRGDDDDDRGEQQYE